jgi:hypothetical protein
MDNGILNNLTLYRGKWFSDLIDTNKISLASQQRPHEVGTILSYVFGTKDAGYSTSLDMLTGGLGNTMTIQEEVYEWGVMIDQDRAVTIRDAKWNGAEITDESTPGLGLTPITLWLEDAWFGPGATIELDDKTQLRIQDAPYMDGNLAVYTAFMSNGNPAAYVDPEMLKAGHQVNRLASAYEEYSEEADILNYNTHFKMRNHLTTMRLSYDITGSAYSTVMAVALKDPKTGQTSYLWSTYQEWVAMREWYKRMERGLVYNVNNVNKDGSCNLKGKNGRPAYIGAGLLEQIAPSNRRYYTRLTAELLEDFLFDLSYNVLGTNERKFVALTGEMGMREFDRILKEKVANLQLMDTVFVTGSGDSLTFGGQFKTYKMSNGIELTLKYFPLYDNTVYNRQLHPVTLKPLESYRMTFLDLGRRDGQANVVKVVRKDREFVNWCTAGSVTPAGYAHSNTEVRSNAKDGYSVHFLAECGIMLRDPRSSGELIMMAE